MPLRSCNLIKKRRSDGFTLAEVVISLMVAGILMGGLINGYIFSARRAEWSGHSLAAHSLAIQGLEQARAAQWDTGAGYDQLPPTNFSQVVVMDVPVTGSQTEYATNFISVSTISVNPPLREIRADCVWVLPGRGAKIFTNSVITCRAPDQ